MYFKQLKCRDLLFTQYDCPQVNVKQDLFSACHYIAYVLEGKRTFHFPGESIDMGKGACAFIKKGGWIAEKKSGEGWCVLIFFIPEDYLKSFIYEYRNELPLERLPTLTDQRAISLKVNQVTSSFFHGMLPYFMQEIPPPENLLELKFRELLFNLLINSRNQNLLAWMSHIADSYQHSLREIMEANYTYNLSVPEFAKIAGRSLATFKREFRTEYQISPGAWLKQKRLDYASLLLRTSEKRVGDICFDCGFENTTHFNRAFKERFRMSPLQFRRENQMNVS